MKRLLFIWLALLIFAVLFLGGCPQRRPEQRPNVPSPQENSPRRPLKEEPTISLYLHETGQTKQIKLESYLEGVVAAEMDPEWHDNALAAQAILARTFTLKKIEEGGVKARGTDASTDIKEFQAYDRTRINDKVRQAVRKTRGEVLTHQGKYINGWFFADGGGQTAASAAEGLDFKDPAPYIKSVKDPGSAITVPENKSWTARFPLSQVRNAVRDVTGKDPGPVTSARIVEKGPSGRATTLQINRTRLSGSAFRLALDNEKMRSTLITKFTVEGGQLVIQGRGYGHGVGMSQWGARALAEQGRSPEEIAQYWFRNVRLEKIWE